MAVSSRSRFYITSAQGCITRAQGCIASAQGCIVEMLEIGNRWGGIWCVLSGGLSMNQGFINAVVGKYKNNAFYC